MIPPKKVNSDNVHCSTNDRDKIEEIKSSIDIVDYIGRGISLHRKGPDDYRGTVGKAGNSGESLIVTKSDQLWHDTKNQCGGDIFSWIAYREGLDEKRDFPEILRIAAEFAGIEFEGLTDEDRALIEEGKEVTATLNEVTDIYHQSLLNNPEAIKQVTDNWGFDLEVIKAFKIGYATGADLKQIDKQRLVKAGLVYKNSSTEFFIHRIMFPYLIKGNTVYLIGRRTDKTPLDKQGNPLGKYKKLLTHDNNPDVSKAVNNKFLFGEDNIKGSDYVLIAEGITDAISAQIRGYPVISAVTTSIKKAETDRISKVIGERPVKICLDIDSVTQAGQNGARKMAETLTVRGNDISIISLPDPEGKKDYDLNDYFRKHETGDFDELLEGASDYWEYILPDEETYSSKTTTVKLKALKKFISEDLREMSGELWRSFVENEVVKRFTLTKKDAKAVIDACEKSRKELPADEAGEGEDEEVPSTDGKLPPLENRLTAYPEHVIKKANAILDTGDPFGFIMKVWNKKHVGDTELGETLLCSVGCTQVLNAAIGIHNKPSGDAQSGKSHGCYEMGNLFPAWKFLSSTFTAKNLYYNTRLHPGVIVYTDDVDLSDKNSEVIQTLKKATADFQSPTFLDTVIDGDAKVLSIPERVTFWASSVGSIEDVQLGTRFICSGTEDGQEHNHEVNHKQNGRCAGKPLEEDNEEILVCRCVLEYICDQLFYVFTPYGFVSSWTEESEKRNHDKFIDILMSVTVFKFRQRETVHGCLVGTLEDWKQAVSIYSNVAKNNSCLLTDEEIRILYSIHEMGEMYEEGVPHKRLLAYMKESGIYTKSTSTLKRTLIGKLGAENTGFKEKVPGFSFENVFMSKLDENGLEKPEEGKTKTLCYTYNGDLFDGIPKGTDVVDYIKNSIFVTCDYSVAEAYEKLFREDPIRAHSLSEKSEIFENWKQSLRNHNTPSEILRNPQKSQGLISEKSSQQLPNNNNIIYINNLRNHENDNRGVAGISVCVLGCGIDEGTHAKLMSEFTPENGISVISEAPACDHAMISENMGLTSEPTDNDNVLNSETHILNSEPKILNSDIVSLLKRALNKFAWDEYHGTVSDIDEFARRFNSKVPEYHKVLGRDAIGYNANKLHMRGWR